MVYRLLNSVILDTILSVDPEHNVIPRHLKEKVIQPLGDRQKFYDDFLSSCIDYFSYKGMRCTVSENDRIQMSLNQPQSMKNYTKVGFKKIRAPAKVMKLISEFWEANKEKGTLESWGTANTYSKFLRYSIEECINICQLF